MGHLYPRSKRIKLSLVLKTRNVYKMTDSVLEKIMYVSDRPYSSKELQIMRKKLFRTLRLGNTIIFHRDCQHMYYAKINGRKEREILETNTVSSHCSVCWKLNRTPKKLKQKARNLVDQYLGSGVDSYESLSILYNFYIWLYYEFNDTKHTSTV